VNEPIDITPGGPIPPADPVAARRRMWIGLLAAGAVASVVAGGVGYAALNQPEQRRTTVLPAVSAPVLPFGGDLLPTADAVPSAGPAVVSPAGPAATGPVASPTSARPTRKRPAQPALAVPTAITTTPPTQPSPQATSWPLTALYSGGGESGWDGITGYGGSVRLTNSGERGPATNWRVRLTVPGGNPVHAGGNATVSQSGERVVFAPGLGGVVRRGDSVTFDFWIDGVLPAAPYGCLVNGHACG
jgi:hypothetical protein